MEERADIGVIGLGVMGQMLALNLERNGYYVAGYDLNQAKVDAFQEQNPGKRLVGVTSVADFISVLEKPHRIFVMVPAGRPVDAVIAALEPYLESGDLLIEGGNSHFTATEKRGVALESQGILYIGLGVSGGEYGALWGPSLMPGGQSEAWDKVRSLLETISAKVDGEPCVTYIGPRGAGHYVKMVHNGIEYGDMQLLAESYDILHRGLGLDNQALYTVFDEWNKGVLESYLVEISRDIFAQQDEETGGYTLDVILDVAKQRGTGKWTSQNALDLGVPVPTINAAVTARTISTYKEARVRASSIFTGPPVHIDAGRDMVVQVLEDALYAAKICVYAQGFALLGVASQEYEYELDCGEIARIWRGGCIIRARLLEKIRRAFARDLYLPNLLLDPELGADVARHQAALRQVIKLAVDSGIPVPAFSSALAYFDAYRSS
ncbi:MAG: NADP-dependent phosphogluconate dehydrogenase, partial [Anaerolineae bacterium]|nr:NADP-dependent phosphogluconate dehydrogenase [Anaerolineae bacterium]